ncbi:MULTISPECIES: hypothetical protein [unclassified Pseudoalteromonas]|uniref:hypothetical protein n=1 Tax=unclassified Pseudoalteromonas TaxID=194690 RepID=UPI0020981360|nr:hypothetical protein [Pseudoalteromonas sp. XMcav2-N]MCO7187201.1 hypothetical protein [Pseudoalteromonas sp. XMcav2-N]
MLRLSLIALALLSGCQSLEKPPQSQVARVSGQIEQTIPSPAQMRVDIDVAGRTSTLNHIDITYVGKQIPRTYSDGKITNSRGYNWWVSKHFALKSDLSEEKVRLYLELLEMSYPHYVELFGMAPANIDNQRIAVVYGSSRERVREAMLDDGFLRGVHKTAGGETMYYNRAGYSFPSHRHHHQRYIVIHETMHAFHMALNGHATWAPSWITEGMADAIASHTYDSDKKQLRVMVFDRAPMNYQIMGLAQYHKNGQPSFEQINDDPQLRRGLNFFIVHFLLSDPLRYQYFKRYLRTLMALNPDSDATLPTANALLKTTFSDWPQLERDFVQFVQTAKPSFYIVRGPWEQNGPGYWLRSNDEKALQRLDITPFRSTRHPVLDFPAPQPHPAINPVSKDSFAALLTLQPEQRTRGEIGVGLLTKLSNDSLAQRAGLTEKADFTQDQMLQVLLNDGTRLSVIDTTSGTTQEVALTPAILRSLEQTLQLGLNLRTTSSGLEVEIKSANSTQKVAFTVPDNVLSAIDFQQVSLLGRNMNHTVTPYLYSHTYEVPDLEIVTANPWYFAGADLAHRAFNTCVAFSAQLPNCMATLDTQLAKQTNQSLHSALNRNLQNMLESWQQQLSDDALYALSGIELSLRFDGDVPFISVNNPSQQTADIKLQSGKSFSLTPGRHKLPLSVTQSQAGYTLSWQGLTQTGQITLENQQFDGVYLNAQLSKDNSDLQISLTGPYSGDTHGKLSVQFLPYQSPAAQPALWQQDVTLSPYEKKRWQPHLRQPEKLKNGVLKVVAVLDVDGEPIKLVESFKL